MTPDVEPRLPAWLASRAPGDVPADLVRRVAAITGRRPVGRLDALLGAVTPAPRVETRSFRVAWLALLLGLLLVLVIGTLVLVGTQPSPVRIYTGVFTPSGPLGIGRATHTATLLHDGRVVITGGYGSDLVAMPSAELFDPRTDSFSPTGSMTISRARATATLLLDGRVLVSGGVGDKGQSLARADLYDPATGTFKSTASMVDPRALHRHAPPERPSPDRRLR